MSHVEATGAVEHHLVGVPAVHDVFEEGIDEHGEVRHQEGADIGQPLKNYYYPRG